MKNLPTKGCLAVAALLIAFAAPGLGQNPEISALPT